MSEKKWTSEDMTAAIERALKTMEGVALELYRRGREPLLEELETVKRERDEARAACPDCAMWAERSARWHEDMQRAERERDEARDDFAFAMRKMDEQIVIIADTAKERDEARAEVERLRIALLEVQTSESAPAWFADGFHDGWKAGAEAMREACAQWLLPSNGETTSVIDAIRALPIPEDKP